MPPDATATKARILDAAFTEFAEYGLAGARVDRIADKAEVNKRSIYVHFGNKEDLFDLVVARALAELSRPAFTTEDIPGYAAAVFDYMLANPQVRRLASWARMERPEPTTAETNVYRPKVEAIAEAQQRAAIAAGPDPVDILALVIGMTSAWFSAPPALRSLAPDPPWSPERLAHHRAALIAAVHTLTNP
jgi:AcrR family transcriptional regulator